MSSIQKMMDDIVIPTVGDMLRSGKFDNDIYAIIVNTTRVGPDDGLSRLGFAMKMAVEIMDKSTPPIPFPRARDLAWAALGEFLRDNRLRFGASGWDWSGRGARDVAHEYVISFFEPRE